MSYTSPVDAAGFAAFPAPAKLNLFLHIVGRRADGYHLLQSVFQLIDAHDTVWLRVRDDDQVIHHNPIEGVPPEKDLTVRAARLLQQKIIESGKKISGVDIRVDKRLPMGGGLGGGSSDAATVLLALNRMWGAHFTRKSLMDMGLALGADVPFFIYGRNAFVEGIGEIMTPVHTPTSCFVVLNPRVHVPTVEIFCDPLLTRNTPSLIVALLNGAAEQNELKNDLESGAGRKYPEIQRCIDWLNKACLSQSKPARMTGSGCCVFAEFSEKDFEKNSLQTKANAVISGLLEEMTGFVSSSLSQHQLLEFADD